MQTSESRFVELRCISCRKGHPLQTHSTCTKCGGILSGDYELQHEIDLRVRGESMWQFREYLPPLSGSNIVSLGEGWTPLVNANNFARKIGVSANCIHCKMEGQNPSGSFKDRPASLSVSLAREWKKMGIFLASSGNAAASTACYSARANIPCLALFRDDSNVSKLGQIAMYGAHVVRVKDLYKDSASLVRALGLIQRSLPSWLNGFVWAKYNPLLVDALKMIAFEMVATGVVPDYVFVPTAGGDLLFGLYKGFRDLKALRQIEKMPKMIVVQGQGSTPTVDAVEGMNSTHKLEEIGEISPTIAGALRSNMVSEHGIIAVKQTSGFGVRVSNTEILEAQTLAAKLDGIFCEVSSAAALAAISRAIREGRIQKDQTICAIITGNGFKDYYPSFGDIAQLPYAEAPDSIPSVLEKMNLKNLE